MEIKIAEFVVLAALSTRLKVLNTAGFSSSYFPFLIINYTSEIHQHKYRYILKKVFVQESMHKFLLV